MVYLIRCTLNKNWNLKKLKTSCNCATTARKSTKISLWQSPKRAVASGWFSKASLTCSIFRTSKFLLLYFSLIVRIRQIRKLKECFASLDGDGGGSIGVEEIKGPLIGLGLVSSVDEVEKLVMLVDEDGSGKIEFGEFLDIILNKSGDAKAQVITEFFKNLTNGKY